MRYIHVPESRPEDLILQLSIKGKKRTYCQLNFCRAGGSQSEDQKMRKKRQILGSSQRNKKKAMEHEGGVIPTVIVAIGTILKSSVKELEEMEIGSREETIQTIALLRSARILRRVLEISGDFLSLRFQWKTTNSQGIKKAIIVEGDPKAPFSIAYYTKV